MRYLGEDIRIYSAYVLFCLGWFRILLRYHINMEKSIQER